MTSQPPATRGTDALAGFLAGAVLAARKPGKWREGNKK
jgi:hypothetical protein